jgi:hypothetical protein
MLNPEVYKYKELADLLSYLLSNNYKEEEVPWPEPLSEVIEFEEVL